MAFGLSAMARPRPELPALLAESGEDQAERNRGERQGEKSGADWLR